MKILLAILGLLFPLVNIAASSDQYREKIQLALDSQPPLCLGETAWPVTVPLHESVWINAKMESLVDAGLATSTSTSQKKTWQLTPQGRRYYKQHGDFCYGRMRIKNIIEKIVHKNNVISILFTYDIENLPSWAKNQSINMAYSDLNNLVMGINDAVYQAEFMRNAKGYIEIQGEPYQRDLFY